MLYAKKSRKNSVLFLLKKRYNDGHAVLDYHHPIIFLELTYSQFYCVFVCVFPDAVFGMI